MKRLVGLIAALLLGAAVVTPASAQDATPAAPVAMASPVMTADQLGLPEIQVAITDNGLEGPAEVTAGRYLVTVTNTTADNRESVVDFIVIPEGDTLESLNAKFDEARAAFTSATPPAGNPFEFLYQATLAGGTTALPGEARQAIVDLTPGSWAIFDDGLLLPAVALNVTGEMPTDLAEPEVTATITEISADDHFDFQIDGTIVSGPQIVKIVNDSDQPHFVEFAKSPPGFTLNEESVMAALQLPEGATPDPSLGLPSEEQLTIPAFAASQSAGTTQWLIANFDPGSYATLCFIPDPEHGGAPHSMLGMVAVFEIA
jgi:hypothetical protein